MLCRQLLWALQQQPLGRHKWWWLMQAPLPPWSMSPPAAALLRLGGSCPTSSPARQQWGTVGPGTCNSVLPAAAAQTFCRRSPGGPLWAVGAALVGAESWQRAGPELGSPIRRLISGSLQLHSHDKILSFRSNQRCEVNLIKRLRAHCTALS